MAYGNSSSSIEIGNGELPVNASYRLDNLIPYKVYHVRAAAQNSTGRVNGPDQLVTVGILTGVDEWRTLPLTNYLRQNYPNPFNPTTTIEFELASQALVTVKVYNTLGQEVSELIRSELMDEGTQGLEFDGSNLPSGLYFYRIMARDLETGLVQFTSVKKMLLVK